MIISVDFETKSLVDIKKAGRSRYAEDDSTEIICMAFAINDGPPSLWLPGQPFPIPRVTFESARLRAWNAQFEIAIWKHCRPSDWPSTPASQWDDTLGDAAMCGFPLNLGKCSVAIGVETKLASGTRLINKLSKPKADGTFRKYEDFPEDFEEFYRYCKQDVVTERAVYNALPAHVTGTEDKIQRATWLSNDRGVPVDVTSVQIIQKRLDDHIESVDFAVQRLTKGHLDSARQKKKLLCHLDMNIRAVAEYLDTHDKLPLKVGDIPGMALDNLRGEETAKVLADWDISDYDRKLLTYQRDLNHASVAKFKKILLQLCSDGTIKDNIQYHGAGTGRDAARGFQLQNLPRNTEADPKQLLEFFYRFSAEALDLLFPVLETASTLIRPMIKAPRGKKLIVSDFGQIEARGVPWLCNEEDILQNFRDGIDPYIAQASGMYDVPLADVDKTQRQYGKLAILACGYQGSHKALTQFAEGYGLTIERKEAVKVVKQFRAARPKLVEAWAAFGAAAIRAVNDAGTPYQVPHCQKAVFQMQGEHLTLTLPSGRKLWYPYAEIKDVTVNYEDGETGEMRSFTSQSVTSMWVSSYTTKWERRGMSGGNFLQNWVQAVCRDLLMEAVLRLEESGYDIVGRVHDEVICLCPDTPMYSIDEVDRLMCGVPDWAKNFPIDSDGYESERYRK